MDRIALPIRITVVLAVAFVCGALFALAPTLAANRATQSEVAQGLTCQCGCGLTVANCNMPTCSFSVPTRIEIDAMLARGMGRDQILASYREKFGEKVLSAPTTRGFNLLAWTMPFMALAFGGAFIVFTARRWHTSAPTPVESTPPRDTPAQADLRRRLADEVKDQL